MLIFFFDVFSAESVQLVHDLGNIFEKVISPAVSEEAESILDAVLMFVRFYEQNEHFNLLTHGVGPGVVAVVMHNFSYFLGDLMGQKLVHRKKYGGKRFFPTMYMDKLRSIVNLTVVDCTDEYTRKMLKAPQETKPVTKTKKGKKTQGQDSKQQQQQQDDEISDDDIEIVSEAESCLTNENDFTTLMSGMGQAYHLPSRYTSKSHYRRNKGEKDTTDDVIQRIKELRHTLEKQKRQINKLTSQNNAAKQQIKQISGRKVQPGVSGLKQSKIKSFVSTQIRESLNLDSSDEEEDMGARKLDSTQQGVTGTGSNAGSGHIPCSGVVLKKPKHKCIDSDSQPSVKQDNMPTNISDDSETELDKLIRKRNKVEEKLRVTQQKLLEQRMEGKAHDFQDHLVKVIRDFRSVIMDCFGTPKTDECLVQARERLAFETAAKSLMGFTFCVGHGFVKWVEKSLLAGQTPEQQYTCTKMDNSVDDPVSGHVTDIIYEVAMPVIVKHEVRESEDDDCEILSFQPAPHGFVLKTQIKEEKLDPKEKVNQKQDVPEDENPWEHEPEEGGSGTKKAEGPENLDNEDMEEDTELDIVNMIPKKRKVKKKTYGATGVTGSRRNLHSKDKTRQDCLSYYLFVKKKKKLFLVFWLM